MHTFFAISVFGSSASVTYGAAVVLVKSCAITARPIIIAYALSPFVSVGVLYALHAIIICRAVTEVANVVTSIVVRVTELTAPAILADAIGHVNCHLSIGIDVMGR